MRSISLLVLAATLLGYASSRADEIVSKHGEVYFGRIIGSHPNGIRIIVDSANIVIPQEDVRLVMFSSADRVFLEEDHYIDGKIIRRSEDSFVLATDTGLTTVEISRVDEIIYDTGNPIHLTQCPETDSMFSSSGRTSLVAGDFWPNMYLVGQLNVHTPALGELKTLATTQPYGEPPVTSGMLYGLGIGYAMTRTFSFEVCGQAFSMHSIPIYGGFTEASFQFYYVSIIGASPISRSRQLLFTCSMDLGSLHGSADIVNPYGNIHQFSSDRLSVRFNTGVNYYIKGEDYSFGLSVGYLYAPPLASTPLDFSGMSIQFMVRYHLPWSLGNPIHDPL